MATLVTALITTVVVSLILFRANQLLIRQRDDYQSMFHHEKWVNDSVRRAAEANGKYIIMTDLKVIWEKAAEMATRKTQGVP